MTDPTPAIAAILGQAGERLLGMTGWIGEHPVTGGDVPHLLMAPFGHGVAGSVRSLAEALGMSGGPMRDIPGMSVEPAGEDRVRLRLGDLALHRPITKQWTRTADECGYVIVSIGAQPLTGSRPRDIDRYLARAAIWTGRAPWISLPGPEHLTPT